MDELQEIKDHSPQVSVMFIHVPPILDALKEATTAPEQRQVLVDAGILTSMRPLSPEVAVEALVKTDKPKKTKKPRSARNSVTKPPFPDQSADQDVLNTLCPDGNTGTAIPNLNADTKININEPRQDHEASVLSPQSLTLREEQPEESILSAEATSNLQGDNFSSPASGEQVMIFDMDTTPQVNTSHEAGKPKTRCVKFNDELQNNEKKIVNKLRSPMLDLSFTRRDKHCIFAGNCNEYLSGEEIKRIKKYTSDLYEASDRRRQNLYNIAPDNSLLDVTITNECKSDAKRSIMKKPIAKDWCKMPEAIMQVLSEEFSFLNNSTGKGARITHCHLMWEDLNVSELKCNPFVRAYSRQLCPLPPAQGSSSSYESSAISSDIFADFNDSNPSVDDSPKNQCSELCVECGVIESFADFEGLQTWIKQLLRSHIAYSSELLGKIQGRCLSSFVVFAFDYSRQLQIAPRRLEYAKQQEEQLCEEMFAAAKDKEENIRILIAKTLDQDQELLMEAAESVVLDGELCNY